MSWPFRRRDESVAGPESERTLALREDAELMLRAQRGNATAFAVLYERYAPQIYRYLAHRTAREDVAEDLTAEVFLNAWQAVGRYHEHGATVRAWFFRMAHNEVIDYYRTHRREVSLPETDMPAFALAGPEYISEVGADSAELVRALAQLPDDWQQLILLRFVEALSFEEIGQILGKQSNACRQMQHRALARLRQVLAREADTVA
jgi:RNA polymerase sigma-70 factor (ECF subfamily)